MSRKFYGHGVRCAVCVDEGREDRRSRRRLLACAWQELLAPLCVLRCFSCFKVCVLLAR